MYLYNNNTYFFHILIHNISFLNILSNLHHTWFRVTTSNDKYRERSNDNILSLSLYIYVNNFLHILTTNVFKYILFKLSQPKDDAIQLN